MSHSLDLREAAKTAASLIKQLVVGRTSTYDRLSEIIGIDKSTLYYFAKGENTESVKLENLAKIIDWARRSDFSSEFFTENQKKLARDLELSLKTENSNTATWISEGFVLSKSDREKLLDELGGVHLGFRMRGSAHKVQVVGMELYEGVDNNLLEWKMRFREGTEPFQKGQDIPESEKLFREVRGYVVLEDGIATCIGRQPRSRELYVLNIMLTSNRNDSHKAMYTTYSQREAIARAMLLVRDDNLARPYQVEIDNRVGDYSFKIQEEKKLLRDWGLADEKDIYFGLSVSPIEFKSLIP